MCRQRATPPLSRRIQFSIHSPGWTSRRCRGAAPATFLIFERLRNLKGRPYTTACQVLKQPLYAAGDTRAVAGPHFIFASRSRACFFRLSSTSATATFCNATSCWPSGCLGPTAWAIFTVAAAASARSAAITKRRHRYLQRRRVPGIAQAPPAQPLLLRAAADSSVWPVELDRFGRPGDPNRQPDQAHQARTAQHLVDRPRPRGPADTGR